MLLFVFSNLVQNDVFDQALFSLYKTLLHHSICNSFESSDVTTLYKSVLVVVVLLTSVCASVVDVDHDLVKLIIYILVLEYSVT